MMESTQLGNDWRKNSCSTSFYITSRRKYAHAYVEHSQWALPYSERSELAPLSLVTDLDLNRSTDLSSLHENMPSTLTSIMTSPYMASSATPSATPCTTVSAAQGFDIHHLIIGSTAGIAVLLLLTLLCLGFVLSLLYKLMKTLRWVQVYQ